MKTWANRSQGRHSHRRRDRRETESADDAAGEGQPGMSGTKRLRQFSRNRGWRFAEPAEVVASPRRIRRRMSRPVRRPGPGSHGKAGFPHAAVTAYACASAWAVRPDSWRPRSPPPVAWVYDLDEVIFVPTGRPCVQAGQARHQRRRSVSDDCDRHRVTPNSPSQRVDIDRPGVTYAASTPLHAISGSIPTPGCSSSPAQTPWPKSCSGGRRLCGTSAARGVAPRLLQSGRRDLARARSIRLRFQSLAISSTDVRAPGCDEPVGIWCHDGVVQAI